MQVYNIKGTEDSPGVLLDKEHESFWLTGDSYPENILSVYNPIFEWVDEYVKQPNPTTVFNFKMDYFNTASAKSILDILTQLESLHHSGNDVLIKWHYKENDEEMLDGGEGYAELVDIPFEFIEI
ncbi:MAG: DUF1987 domain-containing protein [Bacteroidota bacterium]